MTGSVLLRLLVLLAVLLAAACQSTRQSDAELSLRPLAAAELRETLLGHTLYRSGGSWWRSWEYAALHRTGQSQGGSMTGRVWWSNGEERVEGVWEITDAGLYCRTWSNNWGGGKRACFRGSRDGETLVFDYVSGAPIDPERFRYRLLPGNPHGL